MAMFEALIREATDRFGLGTQGAALLNELLALIGNDKTGGLTGFLERFRKADLLDLVASWVGQGGNRDLSALQIEAALGKDVIARIARKVGLAQTKAASALAFLVPKVVDALTPDGTVPARLPADVRTALGLAPARGNGGDRGGVLGRWWMWALLVGFVGLGGLVHDRYDRPTTTAAVAPAVPAAVPPAAAPAVPPAAAVVVPEKVETPPAAPVTAAAPVAAATLKPRLSLSNLGGGAVEVSGVVGDETSRGGILEALRALFGADKIRGDVRVDAAAAPAGWLAELRTALRHFTIPGADLVFDGDAITVGGFVAEGERAALLDKLRAIFGARFAFALGGDKSLELFESAKERTLAALAELKPGYTAGDLVGVLNLSILRFATGSAELSAESADILDRAAAAIKGAPAGTLIEISGHTDSTGDPVGNMALSQARAEAVRKALIARAVEPVALVAQGYGDSRPVAANNSPQGRFQNRRIEFAVVK